MEHSIDREKVIKGLEVCFDSSKECNGCPYIATPYCKTTLRNDVTALLREQEAVEPKKIKGYNPPMYTIYEYECEKCKSPMMNKQPFCMGCGQAVKWE